MGDIFIEYLSAKNLDINKVCFKSKENLINKEQTLNEFYKNAICKNNSENQNKTLQNINLKETKENVSSLIKML